jgi:hypothetical protein
MEEEDYLSCTQKVSTLAEMSILERVVDGKEEVDFPVEFLVMTVRRSCPLCVPLISFSRPRPPPLTSLLSDEFTEESVVVSRLQP